MESGDGMNEVMWIIIEYFLIIFGLSGVSIIWDRWNGDT